MSITIEELELERDRLIGNLEDFEDPQGYTRLRLNMVKDKIKTMSIDVDRHLEEMAQREHEELIDQEVEEQYNETIQLINQYKNLELDEQGKADLKANIKRNIQRRFKND